MSETILKIENLSAQFITKGDTSNPISILKGVDLEIKKGATHAIMGPNGSGKSTLSSVLMGHPSYQITGGDIKLLNNETGKLESIINLKPDERARKGLFMSFQSPVAIPGLPVPLFLRNSIQAIRNGDITPKEFRKELKSTMEELQMKDEFTKRYLNEGFSGGEKKRMEILQLKLAKPRVAILDEIDSGLDIDALRMVSDGINSLVDHNRSFILITHYKRLLDYIKPDHVHILASGKIIRNGGSELVDILEKEGYDSFIKESQVA